MIIKKIAKEYLKKALNFLIIKDYFDGVLCEYNSIKENIYQIETFQNDKLICSKEKQLLIYNVLNEKLILIENVSTNIQDCKIKVLKDNLICIFRKERFSYTVNYILLFEYQENKDKNEYSLKSSGKIPEAANDLLFHRNNIICFKNRALNIYSSLGNKKYDLQTIINLPDSTTNYKGIIQSNGNIGIFGYKMGEGIIFLSLKKKLQLMKNYSIKNKYIFDDDIYYPDSIKIKLYKHTIIMFIGNIYLLSFNNNQLKILKKIYCTGYIDNIYTPKSGEIYAFGKDFVYKLDFESSSLYKVSLEIKGNIKSLGILENDQKIFILKTQKENTKLCHLVKYNIFKHYINYYLRFILYIISIKALALGNLKINNISISNFFKYIIPFWILLKLGWGFKWSWKIITTMIVIFAIRSFVLWFIKIGNSVFKEIIDLLNFLYKFCIDILQVFNNLLENFLQ